MDLDPSVKDAWGLAAPRITFQVVLLDEELAGFVRRGIADGVGDIDRGSTGLEQGLNDAAEVVHLAAGGVFGRPFDVVGVKTLRSVSATRYFWLVQFAPRSSVVICPPWWLKVPTTASTDVPGPRTVIANEPLRPLAEHTPELSSWTVPVHGHDAYQVAVGPIHAGVIESGHFRFHVVGDRILFVDVRLFYKHRGLADWFAAMTPDDGVLLAERAEGLGYNSIWVGDSILARPRASTYRSGRRPYAVRIARSRL